MRKIGLIALSLSRSDAHMHKSMLRSSLPSLLALSPILL